MPPKPATFLEVLQAAVDARRSAGPAGRNIVVQQVLQQLGFNAYPETTRTKDGITYTWRAIPLVGDLVLGADGRLATPDVKPKATEPLAANPGEAPDKPRQPVMWAMSFKGLSERSPDPQRLAGVLAASSRVLLAGRP